MFTEDIISLVSVTISVEVRRHTSMATPERQTKRHRALGRVSPVNPDVGRQCTASFRRHRRAALVSTYRCARGVGRSVGSAAVTAE